MTKKIKIFGVGLISLLIFSSLSSISLNEINAQQASNDKNNKNGIKENRGYTEKITQYDKDKNCSKDLDKIPNTVEYLTYFNCGHVNTDDDDKKTSRDFALVVEESNTMPISNQGHKFKAWTYNGTIPGPTMRMTEGDLVKITVINAGKNNFSHSLHMHSIHPGKSDGVEGPGGTIVPGQNFTYTFTANPYGVYPYHCHVNPIADHINRGLYGMFIIDPKVPREQMQEFAMVMNGYDMNYELEGPITLPVVNKKDPTKFVSEENAGRENEIYTVNGKAFEYVDNPIKLNQGEDYRVYLVNMLEFDLINSFHLHGNMFDYIPSGTGEEPEYRNDIVTLSQGDRGILEFKPEFPGKYMFHAHQTEFTDLGWMGFFNVAESKDSIDDEDTQPRNSNTNH